MHVHFTVFLQFFCKFEKFENSTFKNNNQIVLLKIKNIKIEIIYSVDVFNKLDISENRISKLEERNEDIIHKVTKIHRG